MTTHKAVELVLSVYGLVMVLIVLWAIVHGGKRKPTPKREANLFKPYESYTLLKETELGWRDKR